MIIHATSGTQCPKLMGTPHELVSIRPEQTLLTQRGPPEAAKWDSDTRLLKIYDAGTPWSVDPGENRSGARHIRNSCWGHYTNASTRTTFKSNISNLNQTKELQSIHPHVSI